MFIVLLKFAAERARAAELMPAHKAWIQRGRQDGVFALVGSLCGGEGGVIIAHGLSPGELQARLEEDPFVAQKVVEVELLEVQPNLVDERLGFLLGG